MIQERRRCLRVQQFQDAVPGRDKLSPNRGGIEGETYEFAGPDPSVVLVHGAYADGSSWPAGNPTPAGRWTGRHRHTEPADLAGRRRGAHPPHRALHETPVILAGHSFAGTVISEAGTDPRLAGLVYIAARAAAAAPEGTRQNRLI
jgi:pimeloyl-ACP methyl ester carboxylesterase